MKTRIITLLLAIFAIIGSAYAQQYDRKVDLYKNGAVLESYDITDVDSIKFRHVANFEVAEYRIKDLGTGKYLNAGNYTAHTYGSVGGVNLVAYAESDDQIFTFTQSGSNYILTTKSGYNIVCQPWNVDALTSAGTALTFVDNGNGTYYIMNGSNYFKVEEVDGVYYPYCDAPSSMKATWILEQVGEDVTYTISVSSGEGGTATASKSSVQGGGSVTLTATPNSGYLFKNWTLNGNVVSTQNPYTATVTANSVYVANFEVAEYRIKDLGTGYYLNAGNYTAHTYGSVGGVNLVAYAESDDQIFTFTQSGSNYILTTKSGYNIVCQPWNVDALTSAGTALTFVDNGNGTYYIMNGSNYFKVEEVDGVYYPYCDAPSSMKATWILEQVGGAVTYTISVSSGGGGTAVASKSSVQGGGSVTLTATPNSGYVFKNWTLNGNVVSTQNPYTAIVTANSVYVANFVEKTYTISVSSGEGGTAVASKSSVQGGGSVTLTATPNSGYVFKNWTLNGNVVSTQNPYTATVTANSVYVANFEKTVPTTGTNNGHAYVDLGLSVKWATCNVGATTPEEYGDYFAWGETTPKDYYDDWSTYKYCNGSNTTMTKYCTNSNNGTVDNKTTLELTDDAAHVNWGGSWRMPTKAEQDELRDTNNCTWEWTTQNGENGYKVTSKKNGNSIFLPAAGYRSGSNLYRAGFDGGYWSSSLYTSISNYACYLRFISGDVGWGINFRCRGQSVRAVCGVYTVSVSSGEGGTAVASKSSVQEGGSVTLTATPNSGYVFKNWTLNGNVVSTQNPYTATVTANSEYVANFEEFVPQYVDLGLSVKWATCNVGATTPEEYGDYFAWGETETKDTYDWSTYKYCNGDEYSMTKYCRDSRYGTVDNKTTLELTDDAAHVNWGGSWRMPTLAEQEELMDTNNCTWIWTTQNGVNGYKVTSKKNGNSIFLPAAGYRYLSNLYRAGSYGNYWSSSLNSNFSFFACYLNFDSSSVDWSGNFRYYGRSVRPVCE